MYVKENIIGRLWVDCLISSTTETPRLEDTSCTQPHHSTSGFLQETRAYLLSLKTKDNKPNYCTARHTVTTGFVVVISLLQKLPETLTKQKYVLTYEVRQDHVELFFSAAQRLDEDEDDDDEDFKDDQWVD
ncbi:UNVERIFIED_CONTAM: hypothetical protein FKN15_038222 [Acipenser sinensis]